MDVLQKRSISVDLSRAHADRRAAKFSGASLQLRIRPPPASVTGQPLSLGGHLISLQSHKKRTVSVPGKFVKIHGSKLLLLSLRAGSKTVFVVANLWGFERPRPIHGSYSGSVCPQVCCNVINIMIYGRRGCVLFGRIT